MLKRLFCYLFLVLIAGVTVGYAQQTPTTQGTEFWVSFMRNGYRNGKKSETDKLTLIATAKRSCTVTVSNPNQGGWEDSFEVDANGTNTFLVPDARGYNEQQEAISNKGLYVTATDTISLYIANEAENSYDAANVLPVEALGSRYMIQSNKSIGEQGQNHYAESRPDLLIVATEDDTHVSITPTCQTWNGHSAGESYPVVLNRGECYHVLGKNAGSNYGQDGDFSGTLVVSDDDKPIAVFNGNCITSVPGGLSSGYDHIFEQAMPTDHWGKRFVVTSTKPFMDLQSDLVKVTALEDNTTVRRDGNVLFRLNAGQSNTFQMNLNTEPSTYLESDNPIAVYLYQHSHGSGSDPYGDPSMVWISPVEQNIFEITFSTFHAKNIERHYVNVVCYTDHVGALTLDGGNGMNASFRPVEGAPEFSYARYELVNEGAHVLRCPGGLVAHVYGVGKREGYAYTVGSSAKTLTKQLYVNDILSTELPDGYSVCQDDAQIQFRVSFNFEFDHVSWDFGDGTTGEDEEISHTYTLPGDYEVNVVVYREIEGLIQPFDSLQVVIHVIQLFEQDVLRTTCQDSIYFHGKTWGVPCFEDYQPENDEGCDTIFHLDFRKDPTSSVTLDTTICQGQGVMWLDTLRTETNSYFAIVPGPDGCDVLHTLNLTVIDSQDSNFYEEACGQFYWQGVGKTYEYEGTGSEIQYIEDTVPLVAAGCESHWCLHLSLHPPTPPFERIIGLTQVAVATTFWPGQYFYYLDDSTGMDTSQIQWDLMDNSEVSGQWGFEPHGASCTITAYSMGEKILWVGYGEGDCGNEVFITINCTGYGVEEDEVVNLEVYPNPTHDELTVKGPEILELTLYNLLGQKMRAESAEDATEVKLKVDGLPQALYLLEVRTKKGNKTRLVSVIK